MNISFNMSLYLNEAMRMEESNNRQNSTFTLEELEEKRMRMLMSQHNSSQFMMKNNGTPYNTPYDSSNLMKEELQIIKFIVYYRPCDIGRMIYKNSHPFNLNENQISYNIS